MSGTGSYHDYPQPFRIQKRLVLNQCFKHMHEHGGPADTFNYVTFGGGELYDVMDLLAVFDVRKHRLNIVSYEEDEDVAKQSRTCAVATTLSKLATVSIEIVPTAFFDNAKPLRVLRRSGPFVYFLDDTKTFRDAQANTLLELLDARLLIDGDWLMITSCLRPPMLQQTRFMRKYEGTFKLFYGAQTAVTPAFKLRSHVDLLTALTLSRHEAAAQGSAHLRAELLRKFKYRDTKAAMGLWLYRIDSISGRTVALTDQTFEEFPHAFEKHPIPEEIPNIFE